MVIKFLQPLILEKKITGARSDNRAACPEDTSIFRSRFFVYIAFPVGMWWNTLSAEVARSTWWMTFPEFSHGQSSISRRQMQTALYVLSGNGPVFFLCIEREKSDVVSEITEAKGFVKCQRFIRDFTDHRTSVCVDQIGCSCYSSINSHK